MSNEQQVTDTCSCTVVRPVSVVSYRRWRNGKEQTVHAHCRSRKGQHTPDALARYARRVRRRAAARRMRTALPR